MGLSNVIFCDVDELKLVALQFGILPPIRLRHIQKPHNSPVMALSITRRQENNLTRFRSFRIMLDVSHLEGCTNRRLRRLRLLFLFWFFVVLLLFLLVFLFLDGRIIYADWGRLGFGSLLWNRTMEDFR
jgi:hypothetical protein